MSFMTAELRFDVAVAESLNGTAFHKVHFRLKLEFLHFWTWDDLSVKRKYEGLSQPDQIVDVWAFYSSRLVKGSFISDI